MSQTPVSVRVGPPLRAALSAVLLVFSLGFATPASASRWDLPPQDLTGRAMLLGGESAMARTLVDQRSVAPAAMALASVVPALPAAAAVAPLNWSLSRPALPVSDAKRQPAPAAAASFGFAGNGPHLFGSVALAVGATPLDAMWRRASAPARNLGRWTAPLRSMEDDGAETVLRNVNAWVNGQIEYTRDRPRNGRADHWQAASESLRRGRGDCEDYALAKMALLASLGFDRDDLYLVLVRDLVRRADHAVLAVRLDGRMVVLDNVTDTLLDGNAMQDYRPVMSYSASGRWIHGVAAPTPAPVQIASATITVAGP